MIKTKPTTTRIKRPVRAGNLCPHCGVFLVADPDRDEDEKIYHCTGCGGFVMLYWRGGWAIYRTVIVMGRNGPGWVWPHD